MLVIKYLARLLSTVIYLPNYCLLYVVDLCLFGERFSASLLMYALMWVPKMVLFLVMVIAFCGEFYGIFTILKLWEHGWVVRVAGVLLTFIGLIVLMRKGYLSLIEKYSMGRLKSVKEHLMIGFDFLVDFLGVLMGLVNALLVVNVGKTLDYEYNPQSQYKFLIHIIGLVRLSLIFYIEVFYVRIFFKLFSWRF